MLNKISHNSYFVFIWNFFFFYCILLLNRKWNHEFERWACGFNDGENECSNTYTLQSFACFCDNKKKYWKTFKYRVFRYFDLIFDAWKFHWDVKIKTTNIQVKTSSTLYVFRTNISYRSINNIHNIF